jgi:formylglycine-generating enzyme required for sulfatase activity/serine/threonine protein kinase
MGLVQSAAGLAVRQFVSAACDAAGFKAGSEAVEGVAGFLAERFADHSGRLPAALQTANERAWKALEIALAGESLWDRCKAAAARGEDRAFAQQLRAFLDSATLPAVSGKARFRQTCLQELQAARKASVLAGELDVHRLAEQAGAFARFGDPQGLLDAEWQTVLAMAEELRLAGYANLAWLLSQRPGDRQPLLLVAVRNFFRRAVEEDGNLFHGLAWGRMEQLAQAQEEGLAALALALSQNSGRLEELLADVRAVVVQTRDAVLDIQGRIAGQGEQIEQIGRAVLRLLHQHRLQQRELRPGDSLSIRSEGERDLVKQVVARYRALPDAQRQRVPTLLSAVGKLEVVVGEFEAAQKDFQAAARMERDTGAQAEAHYNAYRASLERRDWATALQGFHEAVRLDGRRFAPFPTGKYQPLRILGAGGFGVAFLCKHRYMDAQVVVKTLAADDLGREADKVFTEAQVLRELDHPAVVRISDCGYVDAASRSRPFVVMEYFAGLTLEEQVRRNGPLPLADALAVARQVARGLHAAHGKNVLHRDVKPANLLVRPERSVWRVKVIDFGLALRQKVAQTTMHASTATRGKTLLRDSIAGTVDYAAPEQMGRRPEAVGPYSDVYGFAKTCCYALFRTPQPLLSHWQSVPLPLAQLLERCLADDPAKRPQGFAEVLAALDALNAAQPAESQPSRPATGRADHLDNEPTPILSQRGGARHKHRKSRLHLLLAGGAVVALVCAVALAAVVLRPGTRVGTLVVEIDQPGAEVYVDGKRHATSATGDSVPIQIEVLEGIRQLRVVKGGFETYTRQLTIAPGGKETLRVTLEPSQVAARAGKPLITGSGSRSEGESRHVTPAKGSEKASAQGNSAPRTVTAPEQLQEIGNTIGMRLVRIPAGKFMMGSPEGDKDALPHEKPRHEVKITRPFYLGKYEVTRGQFRELVAASAYATEAERGAGAWGWNAQTSKFELRKDYNWKSDGFEQTDEHPVVAVSWNDAMEFCRWLSKKEKKHYDLPTEAEWEYACRARTTTRYHNGDDVERVVEVANVPDRTARKRYPSWNGIDAEDGYVFTAPVGQFKPNGFGLHDMHGNVWEWCKDWYDNSYYQLGNNTDPQGPPNGGSRVLRGGSYWDHPANCRAAFRIGVPPGVGLNHAGFRICLHRD